MPEIYCISGMGVDEKIFQNLKFDNFPVHHIKWIPFLKNESLSDYSMRLAEQIDQSKPFVLIGVSFGGMCCSEISKQLKPLKTFLISSCKTSNELPWKIKFFKFLPLHKTLNDKQFIQGALLIRKKFGVCRKDQALLFKRMLKTAPVGYYRSAANSIINWKQRTAPPNIIHIHGTADEILPYNKIKNCNYTLREGTHWMVMNRAREISRIINEELNSIIS